MSAGVSLIRIILDIKNDSSVIGCRGKITAYAAVLSKKDRKKHKEK